MTTPTLDVLTVESERTYVVYEARSGQIVHMHQALNFRGAESRSPQDEQARALELAASTGRRSAGGLRVLPVATGEFDGRAGQRVDVKSGRLVVERPRTPRPGKGQGQVRAKRARGKRPAR